MQVWSKTENVVQERIDASIDGFTNISFERDNKNKKNTKRWQNSNDNEDLV